VVVPALLQAVQRMSQAVHWWVKWVQAVQWVSTGSAIGQPDSGRGGAGGGGGFYKQIKPSWNSA
jgi:hypothetical protein